MCHDAAVLECVVNVSEGRDSETLDAFAAACGADLLDVHADPFHHRSVFTLVGVRAPRLLAAAALARLDLADHRGVHPRIGVVDVVPFVPLADATMADAIAARDAFAAWAAHELGVPCFSYGPERSLPEVRRGAFASLRPDYGPPQPHPSAGACAVGAREVLVAYNVRVTAPDLGAVRRVATAVRSPQVRTLGLEVGPSFQVSCNLVAPEVVGPAAVTAAVAAAGGDHGVRVVGCELVGLVPASVLDAIDPADWSGLDLSVDQTIEGRLRRRPVR